MDREDDPESLEGMMNLEETRKTIEAIYRKHGFVVERWIGDWLKCDVGESCELHPLTDDEVEKRINEAWAEIDATIHRMGPKNPETRARWDSMSAEDRTNFLDWMKSEIRRIEEGGALPDCWKGTREEMIASLRSELEFWQKKGR